jgi:uncharacterized protein YcbK (DUF882 family)
MLSRRTLLTTGIASAFLISKPSLAGVVMPERRIFLANPHTGDVFHDVYFSNGRYIPAALKEIDRLMRDYNNDEVADIDPDLIDLLARLRNKIGFAQPIQITSGYRSPRTNAAARRHNSHVARNSYHMQGKAVDIRVPGFNLSRLRRAAIELKGGGVGTYPNEGFLHLDVGPVRAWST